MEKTLTYREIVSKMLPLSVFFGLLLYLPVLGIASMLFFLPLFFIAGFQSNLLFTFSFASVSPTLLGWVAIILYPFVLSGIFITILRLQNK